MAPGRDDLIAANAARVNAAVNSPSKQTGNVAGASSSAGAQSYSAPRSRMGGNLDVVSALDSIVFQGKEGDASMRGNVAYIRRWKRGNTAQQAGPGGVAGGNENLQNVASYAGVFGPQSTLNQNIKSVFSPESQKALQDLPEWATNVDFASTYIDENIKLGGDTFKNSFQAFTPGDYTRLKALEAFTPTTSFLRSNGQANSSAPVPGQAEARTTAESATVSTTETPATGNLKSANPNGFVNAFNNIGRSVLGLPPAPPTYAGDVNSLGKAAPLPEGMWQFLFNPSELELEAGPEFKTAETWGVSDKANSGQPLHWSHNKNATLKFNSVLLNGFVFGRKVEALEQGLLELFMARDGDGQDGPHVLEFVWGKRVFGPCVIKNVSVKEKQWDEGEVVNAELSFTLEQVPEWTINDGFVDVARPGRQPTVAAPEAPTTTGTGTNDPAVDPGPTGTGEEPGQGTPAPNAASPADQRLCNWALEESKKFQQLFTRVNNPLTAAAFGDPNSIISSFYSLKGSLYSGSAEVGGFVDSRVSSGCKRTSYQSTVSNILKTGGNLAISPQQQALQFIRGCTESTKRAIDEWQRTSDKCKPQRVAGQAARATQAQTALCSKYTGRCSTPGERFGTAGQCPQVNSGRGVICSGGVWTPI